MAHIRILLVSLHGILLGIVKSVLEEQPDMTVVGELQADEGVHQAVADTKADLVVWATNGEEPLDRHLSLFDAHPSLTVIAIRHDGRQSCLWQLRPHRSALGEISPALLATTIRESVVPLQPGGCR